MPIFPEDLSKIEQFDYLKNEGLLTEDQFNELIALNEKIKNGIIDLDYICSNRLDVLKNLYLKKNNFEISDDDFEKEKYKIFNINDIMEYNYSIDKEEDKDIEEENSILNGTIFEAVLTNNENLNCDIKRKMLFNNIEYLPFQFLLDSFRLLNNAYPETFIKNKGIFLNTEKQIDDKNILFYNFSTEKLLETFLNGYSEGPVTIFSKEDIINRKLLVDKEYMNTNFEQYSLIYNDDYKIINNTKTANKLMSDYYKENILYENKVIRIETEKLIKVNIGDLFWVLPKSGLKVMAIGKIINIIKNKKEI